MNAIFDNSSVPPTPDTLSTHLFASSISQGYASSLRSRRSVATFTFDYRILGLALVIGIGWQVIKRTPFRRSGDVDLTSGLELFAALTDRYRCEREAVAESLKDKILAKLF